MELHRSRYLPRTPSFTKNNAFYQEVLPTKIEAHLVKKPKYYETHASAACSCLMRLSKFSCFAIYTSGWGTMLIGDFVDAFTYHKI